MSDVIITPSEVLPGPVRRTAEATAAEAIEAGEAVSFDGDGLLVLADKDDDSRVAGIAVDSGAAGQPVVFASGGDVTLGAGTVEPGHAYYASAAGGIRPESDLATDEYAKFLGIGNDDGDGLHLGIIAPVYMAGPS